jgi:hypothetical protein
MELKLVAPPRDDIPTINHSIYIITSVMLYGGGGGIRTPARLAAPLGFQDRPLQPDLGTPPLLNMVDLVGFEPTTGRL